MSHSYDISVIIPVYNRPDELEKTLESLDRQTLPKDRFQIVIADDGSSADIKAVLGKFPKLNLEYCWQEDQGFRVAAARNLGIKTAAGDILVFNDNGILLHETCLEAHLKAHEGTGNLLLLGYMYGTDYVADQDILRETLEENSVENAIGLLHGKDGMGDGREGYIRRFGEDMNRWYIPWLGLWGGHFSVRIKFLAVHGILFDEAFTSWGGEDNDLGIQLCNAGARYVLDRGVKVIHYPTPKPASALPNAAEFKEKYALTKAYMAGKHKSKEVVLWQHFGAGVNAMTAVERDAAYDEILGKA